jgi:acyl-homoserine-lactone acylase
MGLQTVLDEPCADAGGDTLGACAALAGWDGRANLDSRGAHVWREFWDRLSGNRDGRGGDYWLTPFSADDPVNTPRDLDGSSTAVRDALDAGATAVAASGFAFDAPMSAIQRPLAIAPDIPIFGGQFFEGAFTIADSARLSADGYQVEYGNSYIHTVTWDAGGRVRAEGFVTYSQSTDPANPHFADFTREYSAKRWHRFPFTPEQIAAQRVREYRLTE